MTRHARRVDGNHAEIVRGLRAIGAVVVDVHGIGGALGVLVAFRGTLTLIEIKNPARPKSARKLTEAEAETIAALSRNDIETPVVLTLDDALRAIGAI